MGNGLGFSFKKLLDRVAGGVAGGVPGKGMMEGQATGGPQPLPHPAEGQFSDAPLAEVVLAMTGHRPRDISFYELAFQHSSTQVTGDKGEKVNNERLEFLGDAVFDLAVGDVLFRQFPLATEGFLTETRAKLVNTHALERFARSLGVDAALRFDTRNTSLQQTKSIYADALEALIGALYLDLGFAAALDFVSTRMLDRHIQWDELVDTELNYKSKVFEWSQKSHQRIRFETLHEETHEGNRQHFVVALLVDGREMGRGSDYSKKQAEQRAAEQFYRTLQSKGEGGLAVKP